MKVITSKFLTLLGTVSLSLAAVPALAASLDVGQSTTLDRLVAGLDSFSFGSELLFDNFNAAFPGSGVSFSDVIVRGIGPATGNTQHGLEFSSSVLNVGSNQTLDFTLGYNITAVSLIPGFLEIFIAGIFESEAVTALNGTGSILIDQSVYHPMTGNLLTSLSTQHPPGSSGNIAFLPQTFMRSVNVVNDVSVLGGSTGTAQLFSFTNTNLLLATAPPPPPPTTVPEASTTLGLLLLGGLAFKGLLKNK